MEATGRVYTRIDNYYGTVEVYIEDGQHYISLQDHSTFCRDKISKELYDLIVKELAE